MTSLPPITNESVMSRLPKSTGEEDRRSVENIRQEIKRLKQRRYEANFRARKREMET